VAVAVGGNGGASQGPEARQGVCELVAGDACGTRARPLVERAHGVGLAEERGGMGRER
jgi:hypothetical protein